jgi:hypothetical protein
MRSAVLLLCASLTLAADPLKEPAPKDFAKFLDECFEEYTKQQKALDEKWGIENARRWDIDQMKGTITFTETEKGAKKVVGKVQFVGTWTERDKAWLWGWADKTVAQALQKDALKLREYGQKNKLKQLTDKSWPATVDDGWKMTALAVKLLGADGAYGRQTTGKQHVFVLIRDLKEEK